MGAFYKKQCVLTLVELVILFLQSSECALCGLMLSRFFVILKVNNNQ